MLFICFTYPKHMRTHPLYCFNTQLNQQTRFSVLNGFAFCAKHPEPVKLQFAFHPICSIVDQQCFLVHDYCFIMYQQCSIVHDYCFVVDHQYIRMDQSQAALYQQYSYSGFKHLPFPCHLSNIFISKISVLWKYLK